LYQIGIYSQIYENGKDSYAKARFPMYNLPGWLKTLSGGDDVAVLCW